MLRHKRLAVVAVCGRALLCVAEPIFRQGHDTSDTKTLNSLTVLPFLYLPQSLLTADVSACVIQSPVVPSICPIQRAQKWTATRPSSLNSIHSAYSYHYRTV